MLIGYKRGQTSIVLRVKILNSSVSTGAGLTGLTSASSGLIISTIADNEATATTYTVAGSTIESITTLGTYATPTATKCRFKEVDSTNHKGVYEIQLADARYGVSSAKSLLVSIVGATNAAETDVVIPLRDLDPYDSVRAGLTALPNAAAEAAGGLYTRGSGAGQINQATNGQVDTNLVRISNSAVSTSSAQLGVNAVNIGGTAQTGRDLGASVLLSSGTGTGQISLSSGAVLLQATQTGVTIPTVTTVGSVTGAVGSVTGNVGGNVVGSVGSLTTNNDKTGYTLSNTGIDNILDRTAGVETSFTLRQALRLILSSAAAKLSGAATTTVKLRDINDTKDRITATVDSDGNRTAITTDVT
jgi:hypothetical protein